MIKILNATTDDQLNHVRDLIRAFVAWHRQRHHEDLSLIDQYFDAKAFEEELVTLPGKYAPPKGRLHLALYDDQPAGCIALRELDTQTCEMKRMFVYPDCMVEASGEHLPKLSSAKRKRSAIHACNWTPVSDK